MLQNIGISVSNKHLGINFKFIGYKNVEGFLIYIYIYICIYIYIYMYVCMYVCIYITCEDSISVILS